RPKQRRSRSTTGRQSCRGSTGPNRPPSACSNAKIAWQRHRSIGKVQEGGTWYISGKPKCLSHFILPVPCLASFFPSSENLHQKGGGGGGSGFGLGSGFGSGF